MELLLGSHVREHGNRVGRLAALEFEPTTRHIRRIVFSPDGALGPSAMSCSLSAISLVHDSGEIELVPYSETSEAKAFPAVPDVVTVSRLTRLRVDGRESGRLMGLEVDPAERTIVQVFGRNHWWSRRVSAPASAADYSTAGEIRLSSGTARAA